MARLRRVSERAGGQVLWQVQTRHADSAVGHSVVNVEAVWSTEVITSVNPSRKHDVGDDPMAFLD